MAITVLIVDDSKFFCKRVGTILNSASDINVIGVAHNGREAIDKAKSLQPDVITLDVEMPIMDGVTALKEIVKVCNAKVLMLSSLTYGNAKITLDALDAGATDFLLKSYESLTSNSEDLIKLLQSKIRELGQAKTFRRAPTYKAPISKAQTQVSPQAVKPLASRNTNASYTAPHKAPKKSYKLLAIGASTGGPVALQKLLMPIPENYPYPITITQHMPGTFTGAFASRMNGLCQLNVVEAEDGMSLKAGTVYVAPGGKQMVFEGTANSARIRIKPTTPRLQYSPSIDITFGSASKIFSGSVLGIILTGMGADGTEGSRLLKSCGARIWSQNEASCVVYGMPMSVTKAGISERELAIDEFAPAILKEIR
ncbi:MAG: chemotaxis response regulator protein-glutamate methylesterase [Gammaproteobacteria bacterium]|nr:MAG: chemotaxis response regulator protein-glutamate methylesterase [Gammaproteobacteria bacterium]